MTVETSAPVNAERKPAPFKRARNQYFKVQVKLLIRAISTGKFSFRKLWNVFLCDMAYLFKITKGSSAPYILSLEPWNECNAGCLFCRDKKGKIHDLNPLGGGVIKGKMPAEMAMDIIGQLKDDIMFAVLYTNGEPFLYQDLATVIKFATDNRVSTVIASNGLLMNEQNARGVLEAGLDLIKIQLSGFTQDIYSIQIRYGEVEKLKDIKTRGILLAPDIRKNARELLEQLGLEFAKLDFELTPSKKEKAKIRGLQMKQQSIMDHLKK